MTPPPGLTRAGSMRALAGAGTAAALFAGARTTTIAQTPVTVRIGSGNVEANAEGFYALDQGFFRRNGIDAKITIVRSGGVTMEAIVAGELDTGVGNTASLGLAVLRGIPFVVVAPAQNWDSRAPTAAIIAAEGSAVRTPRDLAGATIGVTSLGSTAQIAADAYLEGNGVDWTGAKYVEIVPSAMGRAVEAGRVAAGLLNDPELGAALDGAKVHVLGDAYSAIAKEFMFTAWFTTRGWIDKNKETAKRFADAIVTAGAWAEANRPQALDILAKYTGFHETKSVIRFGRTTDPALLQTLWDAAYRYRVFSGSLKASEHCWNGK